MTKKSLKVDREKFEGIVKNLLHMKPVKRDDVKVSKKKPGKLIPQGFNSRPYVETTKILIIHLVRSNAALKAYYEQHQATSCECAICQKAKSALRHTGTTPEMEQALEKFIEQELEKLIPPQK